MYRACLSTFLDRSDPSPSTTCSMVCVGPGGVMRFSTRHRIHIDPTEHGANPLQGGKGLRQAGFRLPRDLLKHPLLICLGIMQLDGKGECLSRVSSLGTQLVTTWLQSRSLSGCTIVMRSSCLQTNLAPHAPQCKPAHERLHGFFAVKETKKQQKSDSSAKPHCEQT